MPLACSMNTVKALIFYIKSRQDVGSYHRDAQG